MLTQLISNNLSQGAQLALTEEIPILKASSITGPINSNHSGFRGIEPNSLFNSIYKSPENLRELKQISYFDLLEQTPTIKQLFSTDYLNLIRDLINVQDKTVYTENNANFESDVSVKNLRQIERSIDQMQYGELDPTNSVVEKSVSPQTETFNSSNKGDESYGQIPDYNHLLYQEGSRSPNVQSRPTKTHSKQSHHPRESKPLPYENTKNKKKDSNIGQNILRNAARVLNQLSLKLNNLAR